MGIFFALGGKQVAARVIAVTNRPVVERKDQGQTIADEENTRLRSALCDETVKVRFEVKTRNQNQIGLDQGA
jgi:hypothetical protein